MCPLVTGDALVGFLQPSPKRGDLHRDGRYALHAFPADENEDAFYVSGRAVLVDDPRRRQAATGRFLAERGLEAAPGDFGAQELFEFLLERCLWTQTRRAWRLAPAAHGLAGLVGGPAAVEQVTEAPVTSAPAGEHR